jgi:hypothetical protein
MTPAAYHRIAGPEHPSQFFMTMTSILIASAMGVLITGLSMEIGIVALALFQSPTLAWSASMGMALVGACLWFLWPLWRRKPERRSRRA